MAAILRGLLLVWVMALAPAVFAAQKTILVLGDSLSAEYGLVRGSGWVPLLQRRLNAQHIDAQVVNGSISGDTTAGGLTRIGPLLAQHKPAVVIVELGGNDALRGLQLAQTEANLRAIVQAARRSGARVLLLGMQIPPNYGAEFARRFEAIYPAVARSEKVALVPFFLAGVGDAPNATALFQADRIHPNAQAQPTLLNNVWPKLRPLLR